MAPICLSFGKVTVHAGHEVWIEVDEYYYLLLTLGCFTFVRTTDVENIRVIRVEVMSTRKAVGK